ncbi:hypothetical protein C8A01DRAFT_35577 [Parachaetomium inaequale]|uniref:Protein kinase domain-containing protein n=1 Tax=Parachaetomium inaequale TaxID=2588326 RepID=A0AAN6PL01_9PEZI|nr:hypothetical protein C8A01DRAFT_35577 [Parachaetomium inaequale]
MRPAEDVPWEVDDIALGDTPDDIRITLRCRGTLTYVWVCRTEARTTTVDELFNLLNDKTWAAENALIDALFAAEGSELLHMIFASPAAQREDLHSFLVPEVHDFQLANKTIRGLRLVPVPLDTDIPAELRNLAQLRTPPPTPPTPEYSDDGGSEEGESSDDGDGSNGSAWSTPRLIVPDEDRAIFPRYSATDITVLNHDDMFISGFVVLVDRRKAVAKLLDCHTGVQREYDCVKRISQSKYADTIRTTKLLGFVVDSEDDRELGILEECISGACPCCESLSEMERFHEVTRVVGIEWRRVWVSQLWETLRQLHEIGLTWGGGSASSVIISKTNQVFIIDFGELDGRTHGPRLGNLGSVDGAEPGFPRTVKFLKVEENVEEADET